MAVQEIGRATRFAAHRLRDHSGQIAINGAVARFVPSHKVRSAGGPAPSKRGYGLVCGSDCSEKVRISKQMDEMRT